MIHPQRKVHRTAFVILAVLIPAVLCTAWRSRQAPATMDEIPAALKTEEVKP